MASSSQGKRRIIYIVATATVVYFSLSAIFVVHRQNGYPPEILKPDTNAASPSSNLRTRKYDPSSSSFNNTEEPYEGAAASGVQSAEPTRSSPQNTEGTAEGKPSKYAYALLLDSPSLECPARIAASRLRTLDPTSDIIVFAVSSDHSSRPLSVTIPAATKVVPVPTPPNLGRHQWRNTFAKFHAARLEQYEAVMCFDLDVIVLKSPRHYFESTSASVAAPPAYWISQNFLMSGGPVVFRPSKELSRRVGKALDGSVGTRYDGEMDWFNVEFKDAERIGEGFATLLNGEFVQGDGIYRYWQRKLKLQNAQEVLNKATSVHFIAGWKPWGSQIRRELLKQNYGKGGELKSIMDIWDNEKKRVC